MSTVYYGAEEEPLLGDEENGEDEDDETPSEKVIAEDTSALLFNSVSMWQNVSYLMVAINACTFFGLLGITAYVLGSDSSTFLSAIVCIILSLRYVSLSGTLGSDAVAMRACFQYLGGATKMDVGKVISTAADAKRPVIAMVWLYINGLILGVEYRDWFVTFPLTTGTTTTDETVELVGKSLYALQVYTFILLVENSFIFFAALMWYRLQNKVYVLARKTMMSEKTPETVATSGSPLQFRDLRL